MKGSLPRVSKSLRQWQLFRLKTIVAIYKIYLSSHSERGENDRISMNGGNFFFYDLDEKQRKILWLYLIAGSNGLTLFFSTCLGVRIIRIFRLFSHLKKGGEMNLR